MSNAIGHKHEANDLIDVSIPEESHFLLAREIDDIPVWESKGDGQDINMVV